MNLQSPGFIIPTFPDKTGRQKGYGKVKKRGLESSKKAGESELAIKQTGHSLGRGDS